MLLRNFNYTKKYPKFLCTMSKEGQITLDIQITGSPALLQWVLHLIMNRYVTFHIQHFIWGISLFLAHLTQRVMWAILITWRPSSSYVVRRKLFQKSSPLKVLDQWKPNLVWIITRAMYYVKTRADNSGYTNHRVTCLVAMGSPFDNEQVCHISFHCLS
jgi:hypothetical protein